MRIRPQRVNDQKQISKLYYKLHSEIKEQKDVPTKVFKASNKLFVAEEKNEIVGFVWVTFYQYGDNKVGYIEELYVDEKFRNKGTGGTLVNKAISYLRGFQTNVVFVSVSTEDQNSIGFYKELRFKKCRGDWLFRSL